MSGLSIEACAMASGVSKDAQVDYYRCGECGHVWNVPKDNPDDPPHHVTPLPEEPEK
jgi:hypothetical protein